MAKLDPGQRARLPDTAFAHVDTQGKRGLPIYDEAHVRNALARFNQVRFETDAARERARKRLLNAAKRFGIVPVGFISGQLKSERELGQAEGVPVDLPTGFVTMLMTDIEGSTGLLDRLGESYRDVLDGVRTLLQSAATDGGGQIVETRADELFAVFTEPRDALDTAVAMQCGLGAQVWPNRSRVRVRIGVHSGYPTMTKANYIGMAVHLAARISSAAHGGQVLASGDTRRAVHGSGHRFRSIGTYRLRGIPEQQPLYQLVAPGTAGRFPAPRV